MNVAFALYDFTDNGGESVLRVWAQDGGLTGRDRGALNQKIDMLEMHGFNLPPKLLAGPINKQRHVYKLIIHADKMLRPMLCKGPFEMDVEFTFLLGAIERNWALDHDPSEATTNRETLIRERARRITHERFRKYLENGTPRRGILGGICGVVSKLVCCYADQGNP